MNIKIIFTIINILYWKKELMDYTFSSFRDLCNSGTLTSYTCIKLNEQLKKMGCGGACESLSSTHSQGAGGEGDDESTSLTEGRKDISSEVEPVESTELEQGGHPGSERLCLPLHLRPLSTSAHSLGT